MMNKNYRFYFIVRSPFRNYKIGDEIRESNEIKKIIDDGAMSMVIKVFNK